MKSCCHKGDTASLSQSLRRLLQGGMCLVAVGCGQHATAPAATPDKVPVAGYEVTIVYSVPEELHWEATIAGKSLTADHRKRVMRPHCNDTWDKQCWQTFSQSLPLTDEQAQQIIDWALALSDRSHMLPSVPAPGSTNLQLLLRQAGYEPRHLVISGTRIKQNPAASNLVSWLLASPVSGNESRPLSGPEHPLH